MAHPRVLTWRTYNAREMCYVTDSRRKLYRGPSSSLNIHLQMLPSRYVPRPCPLAAPETWVHPWNTFCTPVSSFYSFCTPYIHSVKSVLLCSLAFKVGCIHYPNLNCTYLPPVNPLTPKLVLLLFYSVWCSGELLGVKGINWAYLPISLSFKNFSLSD